MTNNGDRAAVREWITTGTYQKMLDEPLIGFFAAKFLERQEIKMLKLHSASKEDVQVLVDYVLQIRSYGEMDIEAVSNYEIDVTD